MQNCNNILLNEFGSICVWLYMPIGVFVYDGMNVYICVYMYMRLFVHKCVHRCEYLCIHWQICINVCMHTCICMNGYASMPMSVCVHARLICVRYLSVS